MPGIRDLKRRIGSVKNTQQTTRAMKMVSAAKLRRSQDAIINQRPYAKKVGAMIALLSSLPDVSVESPLVRRDRRGMDVQKKKVLLMLVTSDRGLCGAFNSNVIKTAFRWVEAHEALYESIELGFVGKKGYEYFKNKKFKNGPYYSEVSGKANFAKARQLANGLIEKYLNDDLDEVKVVYNEFKNALFQKTVVEDFLPIHTITETHLAGQFSTPTPVVKSESPLPYLVKPSAESLLEQLLDKNFAIQAYRVLLESQAGEHGARMSAMENATNNADDMIDDLTLQFNKQRQAGITKELLEIIAGSESQKEM